MAVTSTGYALLDRVAVAIIVVGVICMARIPFLRAELDDDAVVVRGSFRTITVRRTQIIGVTDWPRIEWADTSGNTHRTGEYFLHAPGGSSSGSSG